jgi:CRP/FNR family transcriptional regulator
VIGDLARLEAFRGLTSEELDRIARLAFQRTYPAGSFVFQQGEPAQAFLFVVSGRIRVFRTSPAGQELTLHYLGPGDLLGTVAVLQNRSFPATAQAVRDSCVGAVPGGDFRRLVEELPRLKDRILSLVAQRATLFAGLAQELSCLDAHGRVATLLLRSVGPDGKLQLTHQELADMAALSRETVSRILGKWADAGAITLGRGRIVLRNPGLLEELLRE